MEYTAQQVTAFKAEFARRRRLTAAGLLILSLPLYGILFSLRRGPVLGLGPNGWLVVWVAVAAGVGLVFSRIWRCPACGASLGQPPAVSVCRKCGVALK